MKKSFKYTDSELLQGLVSREPDILRAMYERYYASIRRMVVFNHGQPEDADDLFQEVMLVIFQKARTGHFVLSCALGTYLYSVARLLWLKELGRKKRTAREYGDTEVFVDLEADIIEIAARNEKQRIYREQFFTLSEDCQKVLQLFSDGHSIAEITEIMGYKSEQHTKNRRYRCKMGLVDKIRDALALNRNVYGNDEEN